MQRWKIENRVSGLVLGEYDGETQADALDAMARDAGYRDYAGACAVTGAYGDLDVTEIEMLACDFCGMEFSPSKEVVFTGQKCALCGRGTLQLKGGA